MSFFYPKEKEKLKTEKRLLDFIGGRHLQWFFSYDKGGNSWKLFENSICDGDFYGVEDENFSEFLANSICNKDFQGLKIPFISRKYLQV